MPMVPSTKLAYTVWLSHENVAWEIGTEESETHCTYEIEELILYNFIYPETDYDTSVREREKPCLHILVHSLRMLQGESCVRLGSAADPCETGHGYLSLTMLSICSHLESATICFSVFSTHQHSTQKSAGIK